MSALSSKKVNPLIAVIVIVAIVAGLAFIFLRMAGTNRRDPSRGHVMEKMPEGKGKAKMSSVPKMNP